MESFAFESDLVKSVESDLKISKLANVLRCTSTATCLVQGKGSCFVCKFYEEKVKVFVQTNTVTYST